MKAWKRDGAGNYWLDGMWVFEDGGKWFAIAGQAVIVGSFGAPEDAMSAAIAVKERMGA